jgi:hypothetical protein
MSERRKADFKGGNRATAASEKRADNAIALNKEKRQTESLRRRHFTNADTTDRDLHRLVTQFRKDVLVQTGNQEQLNLLHHIAGRVTEADLEKYAPALIMDDATCTNPAPVVGALVRFLSQPDTQERALDILVNITGARTSFDVAICKAVMDSGMLDRFQSTPATEGSLWEVAINVTLSCPEARAVVLGSTFMSARFMASLERADEELATQLHVLICALLDPDSDAKFNAAFWAFVTAVWPFQLRAFHMLQPMKHGDLTPQARMLRANVISSILLVFRGAPDESVIVPLVAPYAEPLFAKIAQLAPVLSARDAHRIMEICTQLTALPIRAQVAMERVPASVDMLMRTLQANDQVVRQSAFLWLGNYMSDSSVYVQLMMDRGVVDTILQAIRVGERLFVNVRRNAVYALMTMFARSYIDYCEDIERSADAAIILRKLVAGNNIFHTLVPFIGTTAQEDVSVNILGIMANALRWKYDATMEALGRTMAEDRIDVILADIKGTANNKLYAAAVEVDDLIHRRVPEDRMQIDTTDLPNVPVMTADGVLQGAYNF